MHFPRSARAAPAAASVALLASTILPFANAQGYSIGTTDEIKATAKQIAADLILFYPGDEPGFTPGILPGPPSENKGDYYWWQGGAMWGAYMDYWHLTGDSTYNDVVMRAMQHQVGENNDYQPRNFTASLGNDDQGFWGMTAILAAENKFPNPPEDRPQWLALAQAVWNTQNHPDRHDEYCGGGMRWQVPPTNIGYNYKNTIANACFFNIGARIARYTGNETYARIAEETWDWVWNVNYIDHTEWLVYDGGHVEHNCTDVNKLTFSYNPGIFIQGAAHLWNMTEAQKWKDRIDNMLDAMIERFFFDEVIFEWQCEAEPGHCSADMIMFKGFVLRWLGQVTQLAPWTAEKIMPILRGSTEAAVKQCTGGATGRVCGFYWTTGVFVDPGVDRTSGAGEQLNVMSAVSSLLVGEASGPASASNGGISQGDVNAGPRDGFSEPTDFGPITTADRAGAAIITALIIAGAIGTFVWMTYFD